MTPVPDSLPDALLIERVLEGERDLYAVLVGRYQAPLYRFALGMLQDADAAADLVQESFVKAYASLATCRDREHFRAWIFRTLRNRCTDHLRAPARRGVSLEAGVAQDLWARESPEAELDRGELRHAVDRALAALPAAQREAFLLKHVEELSYEEIADLLGVGVSALKMRVARARVALQEALERVGIR
ncbi:MAG TPA: RNA polymerase sigma factor [Longimicrobiaceae bacterium]|nr:RNA polymerase sigma factor [Longimicrobiaceae bacterium]